MRHKWHHACGMVHSMINIVQREWLRLRKQPKVMAATFLMPCVLIFLVMGIAFSGILEKAPQKIAVVTDSAEIKEFIAENESYKDILVFEEMDEELETMYDKGMVAVVLEIEAEAKAARLQYDSTKISSSELLVKAQEFVSDLALFMQSEELYEAFADNQLTILEKDIGSVMEREEAKLKLYISIFVGVLIFMAGQPLASFAIDSYVGERERGTYDSIRLSGVEIFQFVAGKTVFTVLVALICGALQLAAILSGIHCFMGSMEVGHYLDNTLMMTVTIVLTSCISLAMLVAVLIYLSTYFEKVRDAATYGTIGILAFTLLSQVSNVADNKVLEYLPFVNANQLILRNAHGSASILPLFVSVVIGVAVVVIVTQGTVFRLKNKEM